jgi:hypothetical protein
METLFWRPDHLWAKKTQEIFQVTRQLLNPDDSQGSLTDSQQQIVFACSELLAMLLYKNKNYGDSALHPSGRMLKRVPASMGIRVRIEDKLKRMENGDGSDDLLLDIPGYFALLRIAEHNERELVYTETGDIAVEEAIASIARAQTPEMDDDI